MFLAPLLLASFSPQPVDFDRDLRPILVARCVGCHGPEKQRGGLRLDSPAAVLRGGDSGPAVVPGNVEKSLLLRRVTSAEKSERMPPTGAALTAEQVRLFRGWIEDGAARVVEKPTELPWSLKALRRPPIPRTGETARNPIDAFLLAGLRAKGLKPAPEADLRTLIRRLKFDLLGLPPTPTEVKSFVRDGRPDAFERLVDDYLSSPQHGERWARHWLDVVRFAESHGFEMNQPRPNAWRYRDYVIRSLNADKPYDHFVREQVAGDALGADEATGFLVAGPWDQVKSPDVVLTAQQRADELHDMVGTTATAFLGLTVGCARCHNHKFDPVSQADYYALKACLEGVQHGDREARLPGVAAAREELRRVEARLEDFEPLADPNGRPGRRVAVTRGTNADRFAPVRAKYLRFTVTATSNLEPCIDELEVFTPGPKPKNVALGSAGTTSTASGTYPNSTIHRLEHLNDGRYGNERSWISNEYGKGWVQLQFAEAVVVEKVLWGRDRSEAPRFADRVATGYRIEVSLDGKEWKTVASNADRLAFGSPVPDRGLYSERTPELTRLLARRSELRAVVGFPGALMAYAGRFAQPGPTKRLHRGDATQPREAVAPAGLANVGATFRLDEKSSERERRLTLAKWLTDRDNPLTARVIVNRLWQHHFGTGIVDTPSDFGRNGGKPSHPELLDWLACELIDHGWSLKHVHRLIVTSAAYRQSGRFDEDAAKADARCRLLWRFPPRRLEAEALRDAVLSVSGSLDSRMGGSGFDLFEPNTNYVKVYTPKKSFARAEFRRMIYWGKPRMQVDDVFGAFDCPDSGQTAPKRNSSTTPLQALNLLNSPFLLQMSEAFAGRLSGEVPDSPDGQVRRAFLLAFGREPTEVEASAAVKLVRAHGLVPFCRALLNANEFLYVG